MTVAAPAAEPTGAAGNADPQGTGASSGGTTAEASRPPRSEACPLCGAPLHPEQEWCLNCGAAARTRLAATPNWKVPIAVLATVAALSLGVLAAALVKLSGGSSSPSTVAATIIRTVPAAVAPTTTPATPTTTTSSATPGASTPTVTTPASVAPATTVPGAGTSGSSTGGARTAPASPSSTTSSPTYSIPGVTPAQLERLRRRRDLPATRTPAP